MVTPAQTDVPSFILKVATKLFAAHGVDATSLQSIADEVGVTKQAVLHHFASKEVLREAVLAHILSHWQDALPKLLLAATASEDRFDAVLGELFRFFSADPDRARVVMREALDRPAAVKKLVRGPVKPWLSAVAGYIEQGKASGRHHPDVDAEVYVIHVLQLVLSAVASASVSTAALERDGAKSRYEAELFRLAKAGLFAPEKSEPTTNKRGK